MKKKIKIQDFSKIPFLRVINPHKYSIFSLVLFGKNKFASTSEDGTIKFFSLPALECLFTISDAHSEVIPSISPLDNERIISCSWDSLIKVWKIIDNTYSLIQTLSEHTNCVHKVIKLNNEKFASCSFDKTIKIWSSRSYELISTLSGHSDYIKSIIQLTNGILVSGSADSTLRFWNLELNKCEHIINNLPCYNSSTLYEISDNKILLGRFGKIEVINTKSFIIECHINLGNNRLAFVFEKIEDGDILCGMESGEIIQFDKQKFSLISIKKKAHFKCVTSILSWKGYIISSSYDGSIKLWKSSFLY